MKHRAIERLAKRQGDDQHGGLISVKRSPLVNKENVTEEDFISKRLKAWFCSHPIIKNTLLFSQGPLKGSLATPPSYSLQLKHNPSPHS